jgi:1,4-alpha-glucan branching enzyme
MNLLNITTQCWRNASFRLPVLRTVFHRKKKTRGKTQRDGTHRNSCCAQRVRLEFYHPLARKVEIAGSFDDWHPGATWMVPLGDGRWMKDLMLLPGRYEYCFVVDGHWMPDPKGAIAAPDQRGCPSSVLVVPRLNGHDHGDRLISMPSRRDTQHFAARRPSLVAERN